MIRMFAPNQRLASSAAPLKTECPSQSESLDQAEQTDTSSKYLSRDDLERMVEDLFENSSFRISIDSKRGRESGR